MGKIRLGILGVGNQGSMYAKKILGGECPEFELVSIADKNPARIEWVKQNFTSKLNFYTSLDEMLDKAKDMTLDKAVVAEFAADLQKGKKLLILTDNAGEIGFDRVLAEELQKLYPHLQITFCVRGIPVANDATREDAAAVGITFPVIDSGNAVGGTAEELLSEEAKTALHTADVILAKGMGNTESMWGCGYNIYYAFLVKCQRFVEVFNAPLMAPLFVKEK